MSPVDYRAYAHRLIAEAAREISMLDIIEAADRQLTDDEAEYVYDLVHSATVNIFWENRNA